MRTFAAQPKKGNSVVLEMLFNTSKMVILRMWLPMASVVHTN